MIRQRPDIRSSEITPETVYDQRRRFLRNGLVLGAATMTGCDRVDSAEPGSKTGGADNATLSFGKADHDPASGFHTDEALTPFEDVLRYNNFYEFGTDKDDPARYGHLLKTRPWSVEVSGEAARTGIVDLEDLLKRFPLQERVYRLRCVEAWSMVIPWVGFPLAELIKWLEPNSRAKYVYFETLVRPKEMPGQRSRFSTIDWPYREGLRMDEAMHPLSLMAVGLYGEALRGQNGAPLRLVVPWKYGFKSIKSIVRISLLEKQPKTTWEMIAPSEYGFFANVNPAVDHPRWSQAFERRLPTSLTNIRRIATRPFNGYGDQVASLYSGMDLQRYF